MKGIRSSLLVGASLVLAGCADQAASRLLAPQSVAEGRNSGTGYTWRIQKELVAVYLENPPLFVMEQDLVSPYTIAPNQTKWFMYRITYTRTNGGDMGPTAVISDNVAAACATLGAGFVCTSQDSDFGLPGGMGAIGTKSWTVTSSGVIQGMLDVTNVNAGCPRDRTLTNSVNLVSNGKSKWSDTSTPVTSTNCGQSEKPRCNQGVGNGPEGCDPGNSNHNQPSNDENGGVPGAPGRQGGHH